MLDQRRGQGGDIPCTFSQGLEMSIRSKFVIANVLMGIGILPLVFCVVWALGILTYTPERGAIIPIMDPIGMIGPAFAGFMLTFAVAGTSAAWSWDLARAHPDDRSRVAAAFRLMTAAVLVSPFVLLILLRFL